MRSSWFGRHLSFRALLKRKRHLCPIWRTGVCSVLDGRHEASSGSYLPPTIHRSTTVRTPRPIRKLRAQRRRLRRATRHRHLHFFQLAASTAPPACPRCEQIQAALKPFPGNFPSIVARSAWPVGRRSSVTRRHPPALEFPDRSGLAP